MIIWDAIDRVPYQFVSFDPNVTGAVYAQSTVYLCANHVTRLRLPASAAVWLKSSLFRSVTWHRLVVGYRRFGTTPVLLRGSNSLRTNYFTLEDYL
jgi:hypothetical protein